MFGPNGTNTGGGYISNLLNFFGLGEQDPLILDLTGNGLNLEPLSLATPYFDFASTGMAQHTAWIGAGTAFLGIAGPDGLIDNGADLIDSFAQLAALAPNNDGSIDASDPIFSQLVVWEDLNGDGICQANEVFTLTDLGIVSISLNAITSNTVINGSAVLETATVTMADGTTREIAQVDLQASTTYTQYVGPITISAAAALLPQVQGYGTLMDLQHAMSADPQLLTDVQTLLTIDPSDTNAFDAAEQTILYEWAGLTTTDPNSRGGVFDAQKLGVMEALTGQSYVDAHGSTNPQAAWYQNAALTQAWNAAFAGILARFLIQDSASALSTDFTLVQSLDYIVPDSDYASIVSEIAAQAPSDPTQALAFWIDALTVLTESISDVQQLLPIDNSAVTTALESNAPLLFSTSILAAAANGNLTFVDGSYTGAGSPDGSTVYIQSNDLVLITATNMTIDVSGSGNEFIYQPWDGQLTLNSFGASYAPGNNVLQFAPGIDASDVELTTEQGYVVLIDGVPGDSIAIADDFITASDSGLTVQFADGTAWIAAQLLAWSIIGTPGADLIYGPTTSMIYDGKGAPAGTQDFECGQGGGDTFIYNPGYGQLEIDEYDGGQSTADNNVLQLGAGITQSDITVTTGNYGDFCLTDGIPGDMIILSSEAFGWPWGIETVAFADGTTWDLSQLIAQSTIGTPDAEILIGTVSGAIYDGKGAPAGSKDFIESIGNNNTFVYDPGYGDLEITSATFDDQDNTLLLGAGITPADVTVTFSNWDFVLADGIAGDSIRLDGELESWQDQPIVQTVQFADGTTWSAAQLLALEIAGGTTGPDVLAGTAAPETFDGKGAPIGSEDLEIGGGGGDTFVYNPGYGSLEINEFDTVTNNTLQLGAGITEAAIQVSTFGSDDLFVTDGIQGDQIEIDNQIVGGPYGIQYVQFADGTVWTAAQLLALNSTVGTPVADKLYAISTGATFDGMGAPAGTQDYEQGMGGGDTFVYNAGYGQLEINETDPSANPTNTLQLGPGITEANVTVGWEGSNIDLTDDTQGDLIILDGETTNTPYGSTDWSGNAFGVQDVQFADGTTWDLSQLLANIDPNGIVEAYTGGIVSIVSPGCNNENGFLYAFNGGTIALNGATIANDVSVIVDGPAASIAINSDNFINYGTIDAEGTASAVDIAGSVPNNYGTIGAYGTNASVIYDTDQPNYGIVVASGDGASVTIAGTGLVNWDTISADGSACTIVISGTNFTNYGRYTTECAGSTVMVNANNVTNYSSVSVNDSNANVTFNDTDYLNYGTTDIEGTGGSVLFNDTNSWNSGKFGVDASGGSVTLNASNAYNDGTIELDGAGATLSYNATNFSNDGTIDVDAPYSTVTINATSTSTSDTGTVEIDADFGSSGTINATAPGNTVIIDAANVAAGSAGTSDTFIYGAGYGQVELSETDPNPADNNVLQFGTGIAQSDISVTGDSAGNLYLADGTDGDQIQLDGALLGSSHGVQTVAFADGTSWTWSQLIAQETTGTTGADTLYGTPTNDIFDGKGAPAGSSDTEIGNGGDDTYIFNAGYGALTIDNAFPSSTVPAGQLSLGLGLTESNLWFMQSQNNLVIDVLGSEDSITVQNWFGSDASADLAQIVGGDGMRIDTGIAQLTMAMAAYQAAHPSFNPPTANAMPTDTTLQTARAAAWHA